MSQYVVVDLEMCKVSREKRKAGFSCANETIQIGAVRLNDQFQIVDEFNTYVKPEYGYVDWYITNLTGIRAEELKGAPKMQEALMRFIEWIPNDAIVTSWSNSDLKQIQHEVEAKEIICDRLSAIFESWIDCQKMFSERIDEKKIFRLSEALIAADIIQEGQEHDGLVDAYNTAKLFAKMMLEPVIKMNSFFEKAISEEPERLSISIGNLLCNVKFA